MKKLILIFLTALSLSSFGQQLADVSLKTTIINGQEISTIDQIYKLWKARREFNVVDGFTYSWKIGDDTARYFKPSATPPLLQGEYYKATITVTKISTTPTPSVISVDATPDKVNYSNAPDPKWILPQNPQAGWFGNTISYSNIPGSFYTFSFTGTGIDLMAEKKTYVSGLPPDVNHGTGKVTLSLGATIIETVNVSFSGTNQLPALIYSKKNLPYGTYTIREQVTIGYNLVDFFKVYSDR